MSVAACVPSTFPSRERQLVDEFNRALTPSPEVKPILRFPARIGVARFEADQIVPIPAREGEAWLAFAQSHSGLGSFVAVSPLVTDFAMGGGKPTDETAMIDKIRIGAARQQVDALLLYTTQLSKTDQDSPLSVFDLTIVGAYVVPSRRLTSAATATALLFDVHNGYAYGKLEASATRKDFVPSVGSDDRGTDLSGEAAALAVKALSVQVGDLATKLRAEANERELAELREPAAPPPARSIPSRISSRKAL